MPTSGRHPWAIVAFWLAAALVVPVWGQAGQQPNADLTGTWSIDTYLSDHGEQIARAIEFDTGEFKFDTSLGTAPRGRSGAPAANDPERRDSGREGRGGVVERLSEADRTVLAELIRPVRFPPLTLTISQSDQTLTIVGNREPYTMRTDGKAERHVLETGSVNRTAQWTGPQLRVAYEVSRAGILTYNYSIVPTTGQLLIRINFERMRDEPGPFDVKIVYNRRKL
jgi:hypothetical protein